MGRKWVKWSKKYTNTRTASGTPVSQRDEKFILPDEETRLENAARCKAKRASGNKRRNRRRRIGKRISKSPAEIQAERLAKGLEWFKGVK